MPRLLAVASVTAAFFVAIADFHRAESRVPDLPRACTAASTHCAGEQNAAIARRFDRARELGQDYRRRAWGYAALAVAAVALLSWWELRRSPETRARTFADLGVLGVVTLVAATVLLWRSTPTFIARPAAPVYTVAAAFLAMAALGTSAVRVRDGAAVAESSPARRLALGGLAATGLTIALALIYGAGSPGCDGAPGWIRVVAVLALASTVAALGFAALALATRRWIVALACVVLNPAALLFMLANSCLD
jgi:hypothetical protein